MDLNDIAVFTKVVEAGSFTGAATLLKLPKSTVSAKVQSLERDLGLTLIRRTTRKLSVTEDGLTFFKHCMQGLEHFASARAIAQTGSQSIRGKIRVTAPYDLGTHFMPGFLQKFLKKYPEVTIDLILTGRVLDLVAEGIDVALRASNLKDSTLIAKRITASHFNLFASPKYLAQAPDLKSPLDLKNHLYLRHTRTQTDRLQFTKDKERVSVDVNPRIVVDELSAVREFAVAGLGIGIIPNFIAREEIKCGALKILLPEWQVFHDKLFVVYPSQKFQPPRTKVFVKEVSAALETFFHND